MKFPVDLLADVSQADLERSAQSYMNDLVYSDPDSPEQLTISGSTKVTIDIGSAGYTPLYGSSDKHKLLGLFPPNQPLTAVALHILDRWWSVEDILRSSDPARDGVLKVQTTGERIVLYILNRIIYRAKEMGSDELPFLCHGENDYAKILWKNGEAIGFYSVKPAGTLCNSFSSRRYELPVMDSLFVRQSQRGKGFGLQMLEDFVQSFQDDCLGLRYPLTKSMYKMCEKYLCQNPEDADLLWEVEAGGGLKQRRNIANKIQAMNLSVVSKTLSFTEESHVTVVMKAIPTQVEEAQSRKRIIETYEDVTTFSKDTDDMPVVTRGRSSGSKQRKSDEKVTEDKSGKVIRIEDIEAEPSGEVCEEIRTEVPNVSETEQTEVTSNVAHGKTTGEEELVTLLKIPDSVVDSQDLKEADDATVSPAVAEAQDEACHHVIIVENEASKTREAGEESGEDEEISLVKVSNESQTTVADSEESSMQQDSEEGGTMQTISVVNVKEVESKTPRRRSQRLSMEPNSGGGRVLRRRTIEIASTPKKKHTKERKSVNEDIHEEVGEPPDKEEAERNHDEKASSESESEQKRDVAETSAPRVTQEERDDESQNTEAGTEEQCSEGPLTGEHMGENHQAEEKADETMEEKSTVPPDVEEVTSLHGEAPVEETEDVSRIDKGEKEAAKTSETTEDGESSAEVVTPEEPHDGDSDSRTTKLPKSSVALLEIKTSPDLSVEEQSGLPVDEKCDSQNKEEIQPSGQQTSETSIVEDVEPESETEEIDQDKSVQQSTPRDENKIDVSHVDVPVEGDETNEIQEVAADEQSEEEHVVVTRSLRKRKKTSVSPRRKSKRVSRQHKSEREKEEETTADESTETEETKRMTESSDTKAEEKDEEETSPAQDKDDRQPEVETEQEAEVPDVSLPEQTPAEQEHSAVRDTDEQESASEQSSAEDEPPIVTRTLRKGRKSVPTAGRRKSKRRRKQQQQEEDNEEETPPDEEIQVPEESEAQESSEKMVEEKNEEETSAGQKEANAEPENETQIKETMAVLVTEQNKMEEQRAAVSEIIAEEQEHTSVSETGEDTTHTDILSASEEVALPSPVVEEMSKDLEKHLPHLQRLSVVLLDVNKSQPEDVKQTADAHQAELEEDIAEQALLEEPSESLQSIAEKPSMDSFLETGITEPENLPAEDEQVEDKAPDTVTTQETGSTDEAAQKNNDVVDVSLAVQHMVEEEESVISQTNVEEKESTCGGKTIEDSHDTDTELVAFVEKEATSELTEEDQEPVVTRTLRKGRKSAAATPRRKSKRGRTNQQEVTPDEETQEPEEETSEQQVEDMKEEELPAARKDDVEETDILTEHGAEVAGISVTEQSSVDEQKSIVLESCAEEQENIAVDERVENKTNVDVGHLPVQGDETNEIQEVAADEQSDEHVVVTRSLRKRKKTSVSPRRKSKRVSRQHKSEREKEEETTADESTETEETKRMTEESEQESSETMIEEKNEEETSPAQDKDDRQPEVETEQEAEVPDVSLPEQTPAEQEHSAVRDTDEQESASEQSSAEDEPPIVTRTLRKGRKSVPTAGRRKSKRRRKQQQQEEDNEEETPPDEEIQVPEESEAQESSEKMVEEKNEEELPSTLKEDDRQPEVETEQEAEVTDVPVIEQTSVEEKGAAVSEIIVEEQEHTSVSETGEDTTHTDILSASEEVALPSPVVEEMSKDLEKHLPHLQRLSVVLLDVNKSQPEDVKQTADAHQAELEEDIAEQALLEEPSESLQSIAEKPSMDSFLETGITEPENLPAEDEQVEDKAPDTVTTQETGSTEEAAQKNNDVVDVSLAVQHMVEEEESVISQTNVEEKESTCGGKTIEDSHDTDTELVAFVEKEATSELTEEDQEPVVTRSLRKGRKSAAATPRRKSKRGRTNQQEVTPDEETQDPEEETSEQQVEDMKEEELPAARKDDVEETDILTEHGAEVAGISVTEQSSVDEQKSIVLESCAEEQENIAVDERVENKTNVDVGDLPVQGDETNEIQEVAADEQSEEEHVVVTRSLRKRKKTSVSPRRKSKRVSRQHKSEREKEEETTADESTETEETKRMTEESEQESSETMIEEKNEEELPSSLKENDGEPEAETEEEAEVTDVPVIEKKSVEEKESAVSEKLSEEHENTSVNEIVEDTTNTDVGQVLVEKDAPNKTEVADEQGEEEFVGVTRTLRKRNKTSISPRHKSKKVSARFEEDNNVAASDQSAAEEPVMAPGVLRKGRKSSPAAPRCKSKRTRTELQPEEEKEKISTDEDIEIKQAQTALNESDESQKVLGHDDEDRNEEDNASPKEGNEMEHVLAMAVISLTGEEEGQSIVSEGQDNSTEPQLQTELLEAVAVVSLKKQNAIQEELPVALEPSAGVPDESPNSETPEDVLNTDVGTVPSEPKPVESLGVEETTEPVQEELDDQSVYEHVGQLEDGMKDQNMDNDATVEIPGKHVPSSTFDTDEAFQIEKVSHDSSEEEVEPTVITKRVLRGRSIPSFTITPKRKSKQHSAKIENTEESSDEETSPPTSQKRLRKRRSTEVTPIRKSKRHSNV